MAKQNRAQKRTVGRVMHEYKHGELERGRGGKVKNPRQAIAIALSEAGASNQQSPSENRRRYSRTKAKEHRGQTAQQQKEGRNRRGRTSRQRTRAELYREAQKKRIPGRSRMNKAQLERALRG
jgi:hypothetical protein